MKMPELDLGVGRWLGLGVLLIAACVSSREPPGLGGESHFLQHCAQGCGSGLDCIQGVCTRGCLVGKDSCTDLASDATCTAASVEPGQVAICDVFCARDAECAGISAGHRCEAGFCRAPASVGGPSSDGGATPYPTDKVFVCPENVKSDPVDVKRSLILGDQLVLQVAYGGGCKEHSFSVCFEEGFRESYPVQTTLRVIHDAHGDTCEAYPSQELKLDLTPLAQTYEQSYRAKAGLISTNFGMYAFGPLSCEERARGAAGQVVAFSKQLSLECTQNSDCVEADNSTSCTASCGTVASKQGATEFASWLATTSSKVCGNFEADGCGPVLIPPCDPPGALRCVGGQCVDAP